MWMLLEQTLGAPPQAYYERTLIFRGIKRAHAVARVGRDTIQVEPVLVAQVGRDALTLQPHLLS